VLAVLGIAVFLRSDHEIDQGGGASALSFGRAIAAAPTPTIIDSLRVAITETDWTPDLGARIGSTQWWRGTATCISLIAATCYLSPGFNRPLLGTTIPRLSGEAWDEARTQSLAPLAWGSSSGRRMAANDFVRPLAEVPERPIVDLTATLGSGDSFDRTLERAGISRAEAGRVRDLVGRAMPLSTITPGTQLDLILGRRESRDVPRPLEQLRFRARFDLNIAVNRTNDQLVMTPEPIAIDRAPLRIRGLVGQSLYRSARAAGAPARAVEAYIRALASRLSIGRDVRSDHIFDIIVEQARAATGEIQLGQLLFAGLDQGAKKMQLMRWGESNNGRWYEASGVGKERGVMSMPVAGRTTSGYGVRFHPILGTMRMHKGIDIGAAYGTPVHAASDGIVAIAGRNAGYGNFIKLDHAGGLASGYGHLSRIAVRPGTGVVQGQIIGYVGSTGMSTGPHLHYELWRNGVSINPGTVSFNRVAQLSGNALRAFKAKLAGLLAVKPGAH